MVTTKQPASAAARMAATLALAALGAATLTTAACGPRAATKSASADSALARDLALANADAPAGQPQLNDTAAAPTGVTTPAGAPAESAPPPASTTTLKSPAHAAVHHTPKHAPTPAPASAASGPTLATAPAPAPKPPLVAPSGTSFDIVIGDTVTTATAHVGDPVNATVAANVSDASGTVVIPAGAPVTGAVAVSSGPAHTPHLGVSFTSVAIGGQSYAVQATVTALPVVQSRRTARVAQVGEVGAGAVVGGLLGRAIGGRKSGGTAIGAIAGAAAGVAVADKTESHDAVLPRGARVTMQLTAPVAVQQ